VVVMLHRLLPCYFVGARREQYVLSSALLVRRQLAPRHIDELIADYARHKVTVLCMLAPDALTTGTFVSFYEVIEVLEWRRDKHEFGRPEQVREATSDNVTALLVNQHDREFAALIDHEGDRVRSTFAVRH
jgi:hypothetical protein